MFEKKLRSGENLYEEFVQTTGGTVLFIYPRTGLP